LTRNQKELNVTFLLNSPQHSVHQVIVNYAAACTYHVTPLSHCRSLLLNRIAPVDTKRRTPPSKH